jgi:hypothetical protein
LARASIVVRQPLNPGAAYSATRGADMWVK